MGSVFEPIGFIRYLPSIVAEKNVTKKVHICSMCIKINKVGKQEVRIWRVRKRYPQYGIPIWRLWPNIRFPSWEAFFDPSDSYFLFAEERGYHKWALAHSSSCYLWIFILASLNGIIIYCKYLSTFVLQIQIRMWMNSLPKRNKVKIYCQYLHEDHMCKRKILAKKKTQTKHNI
jgi:hypothetical protein